MKNNYVYIAFISIFIFINVALFASRLYEYRHHSGYVMLARACGKKTDSYNLIALNRSGTPRKRVEGDRFS